MQRRHIAFSQSIKKLLASATAAAAAAAAAAKVADAVATADYIWQCL